MPGDGVGRRISSNALAARSAQPWARHEDGVKNLLDGDPFHASGTKAAGETNLRQRHNGELVEPKSGNDLSDWGQAIATALVWLRQQMAASARSSSDMNSDDRGQLAVTVGCGLGRAPASNRSHNQWSGGYEEVSVQPSRRR